MGNIQMNFTPKTRSSLSFFASHIRWVAVFFTSQQYRRSMVNLKPRFSSFKLTGASILRLICTSAVSPAAASSGANLLRLTSDELLKIICHFGCRDSIALQHQPIHSFVQYAFRKRSFTRRTIKIMNKLCMVYMLMHSGGVSIHSYWIKNSYKREEVYNIDIQYIQVSSGILVGVFTFFLNL